MTINEIPVKTNKKNITDTAHLLSADEFNTVVDYIKYILGVLITQEEYEALETKDDKMYYYIVEQSQSGGNSGEEESGGTSGTVSSTILTLDNATVSGTILTITNATVSGNILTIN